ncbi:hypothetical protein VaNZ11_014384, partial [Volvox africanus]
LACPGHSHQTQVQRSCLVYVGRDRGRDGASRSTSHGPGTGSGAWLLPQSLVSERRVKDTTSLTDPEAPLTVYTIRFTTGVSRGAALSEPYAAVNVCLIGRDGRAALHRVSPVNDPLESRAHTVEMCQLIGPDVGADCSMALSDAVSNSGTDQLGNQQQQLLNRPLSASGGALFSGYGNGQGSSGMNLVGRPPPPPPPKRRFQEGSVDEVSVLFPELGPLAAVLVGVERGTWYLDEMDVASSRTQHMDRFVCRRQLGGIAGEGAALLTPVPVGAVVYGEGEAAMILSKEQATALWSLNMSDYSELKRRVAATTALLVASGASLAALMGGTVVALPYAAGGVVGLIYQWMLMREVDHVMEAANGQQKQQQALAGGVRTPEASAGRKAADSIHSSGYITSRVLGSMPARLGFVCASATLGMALLSREEAGLADGAGGYESAAAWQLALGVLGFLTYKAALVGVSMREAGSSPGASVLGSKIMHNSGGGRTELEKYKRD